MEIVVRKPTDRERAAILGEPIWECGISRFDWHYDQQETALLVEGAVTVEYDGGSIPFGAGDYVVFPRGLTCVWAVTSPVKKHYRFD